MAINPRQAVANMFGNGGGTLLPEGMSQLFWDEINASPEAEAIRRSKNAGVGASPSRPIKGDPEIRAEINQLIAKKWAETPPEKQEQYHHQDKIGSKAVPGSPEWDAEQRKTEAGQTADLNTANFEGWQEGAFADLEKVAADAAAGDQAAIDRLTKLIDGIQDPEIKDYVGDYVSQAAQAGATQRSIDDQYAEFEKLRGLTDPTITAQERLMQEMSRRKQEQDLRSQRGAFANELQARGVYGSGAELTMNLQAQQEAAQRRAYEEMQAQANAQNRAMKALEQSTTVAGDIRRSEAQESQFRGTAADKAAEFNKTLRDGYDRWVNEQKRKFNEDATTRETGLANTTLTANNNAVARQGVVANTGLTGVTTGNTIRDNALATKRLADMDVANLKFLKEGREQIAAL